jgi:hypothetical protein
MVNFDQIKKELIEGGYFADGLIEQCLPHVVVNAEFYGDDEIGVKKIIAGFSGEGIFFKGLPQKVSDFVFPVTGDEDEFIASVKEQFPEIKVTVKID